MRVGRRWDWCWETFILVSVAAVLVLRFYFRTTVMAAIVLAFVLAACLALEENQVRLDLPRKLRYETKKGP